MGPVRRFGISDLLIVGRLQRRGIWLDPLQASVGAIAPAWMALSAPLRWWASPPLTYVSPPPEAGMIQAQLRVGRPEADVTFLSPALAANDEAAAVWRRLLMCCVQQAGRAQVQRLFVAVPEASRALISVLHQVGFFPYTREEVYCWQAGDVQPDEASVERVRPLSSSDEWPLQRMLASITPRLVQQAEGGGSYPADAAAFRRTLTGRERYLVLVRDGEIAGLIMARNGRRGDWLQLWGRFRREEEVLALVRRGLDVLQPRSERPVYCLVREYQGGARVALSDSGFEHVATWSCLVKHTVVRSRETARRAWHALEVRAEPTAPGAGL